MLRMGFRGLRPDCDRRDGGRPTDNPRSRRFPGPEPYEDDRPDAVSPPMEPSVPARLATSSGSGASRRRTASASCAGDSPVRAAFARSRSSRFSRRRCLADCFSPNKVSLLEVGPQFNRPDRAIRHLPELRRRDRFARQAAVTKVYDDRDNLVGRLAGAADQPAQGHERLPSGAAARTHGGLS